MVVLTAVFTQGHGIRTCVNYIIANTITGFEIMSLSMRIDLIAFRFKLFHHDSLIVWPNLRGIVIISVSVSVGSGSGTHGRSGPCHCLQRHWVPEFEATNFSQVLWTQMHGYVGSHWVAAQLRQWHVLRGYFYWFLSHRDINRVSMLDLLEIWVLGQNSVVHTVQQGFHSWAQEKPHQ